MSFRFDTDDVIWWLMLSQVSVFHDSLYLSNSLVKHINLKFVIILGEGDVCFFLYRWKSRMNLEISRLIFHISSRYSSRSKFKNPFRRRHFRVPRGPTCRVSWRSNFKQKKKISGNNHAFRKNKTIVFLTQKWVSGSKFEYFFRF